MSGSHTPWYRKYSQVKADVEKAKAAFVTRCKQLGLDPDDVQERYRLGLITRAVQESNWQEGIVVPLGRTQEIVDEANEGLTWTTKARLDLSGLVQTHARDVRAFKRKRCTLDELATFNLFRAHVLLTMIAEELASRQSASLAYSLSQIKDHFSRDNSGRPIPAQIQTGFELVSRLLKSKAPVVSPQSGSIATEGERLQEFLNGPFEELLRPMDEKYIHGLHKMLMMGVMPSAQSGKWRKCSVSVGNPEIVFPPPEVVPSLMREFVGKFPTVLPSIPTETDYFLSAARTSYNFVRIHPYTDGNGRISRLLMNLVLWGRFPPVSVASRAKGRHRYRVAIRRADRGNLEPLACLIAIGVYEGYSAMLNGLQGTTGAPSL